jgi:hypothetical protein
VTAAPRGQAAPARGGARAARRRGAERASGGRRGAR